MMVNGEKIPDENEVEVIVLKGEDFGWERVKYKHALTKASYNIWWLFFLRKGVLWILKKILMIVVNLLKILLSILIRMINFLKQQ